MEVTYDGTCFGCGPANADGLRMSFEDTGTEAVCEFELDQCYQSWRGMIHGGLIALMLDEAVGWAARNRGCPGLTGKLAVRYRTPLAVGERVRVRGWVTGARRNLVYTAAAIERMRDGGRVADATATLMTVPARVTG